MQKRYYLDHNATTPVRQEVVDAMLPYMTSIFGNSLSLHWFGQEAKKGLEESREKIAGFLGAEPEEIIFTGCGTESDNIAIAGYLSGAPKDKNGFVTTSIEHGAVLKTAEKLRKDGFPVTLAGVDNDGIVDLEALRNAVGKNTGLVSIMHANNETGAIQPVQEAAKIAREAGALFHTDAVQSAGKVPIRVHEMDIDMLSMSAHKMNALKGVGALSFRKGISLNPVM
jgi:cysteine desulfurase